MNKRFISRYRKWFIGSGIALLLVVCAGYYYFCTSLVRGKETVYLHLDSDDTLDSICSRLSPSAPAHSLAGFRLLAHLTGYDRHIRSGHYAIAPGEKTVNVLRRMKNGIQSPVQLVIQPTWTKEMLAAQMARQLQCDSNAIATLLNDADWCRQQGFDTATVAAILLPDNYEVYWNIAPERLLLRMKSEHDKFWNEERKAKAAALHLTPNEVTTLASIVDAETGNAAEKPTIAGLYYNRLQKDMPLQADPTVKFALRQFGLKRIYNSMLRTDSPYNTYVHRGLPPGPIRITTKEGIDAVLNMQHHDYLYMCAKEDFSGTHNFAATYGEHQANAARYVKALNQRKIK